MLKGMWMKTGMWQYVDYSTIVLAHLSTKWVAVHRTSWCVVRRQCFECGHSRKPDCDETCVYTYLGKVLIWLLTGQNLCHPGVIFD